MSIELPPKLASPTPTAGSFDVPEAMRNRAVAVVGKLLENSSPKIQISAVKLTIAMVQTSKQIAAAAAPTQPVNADLVAAARAALPEPGYLEFLETRAMRPASSECLRIESEDRE